MRLDTPEYRNLKTRLGFEQENSVFETNYVPQRYRRTLTWGKNTAHIYGTSRLTPDYVTVMSPVDQKHYSWPSESLRNKAFLHLTRRQHNNYEYAAPLDDSGLPHVWWSGLEIKDRFVREIAKDAFLNPALAQVIDDHISDTCPTVDKFFELFHEIYVVPGLVSDRILWTAYYNDRKLWMVRSELGVGYYLNRVAQQFSPDELQWCISQFLGTKSSFEMMYTTEAVNAY